MTNLKKLFFVNSLLLLISTTVHANDRLSLEAFMSIDQSKIINGSSLAISVTSMGGKGEVNYQLWLNGRRIPIDGLGQAVITAEKPGNNLLTLIANTSTEQATAKAQFKVVAGQKSNTPLSSLAKIKAHYESNQTESISLVKKH